MADTFEQIVSRASKGTVIVRYTKNQRKEFDFCTGMIIGECEGSTIIMTVGHFLAAGSNEPYEVVFSGYLDLSFNCTTLLHVPRSEILIATVEKPEWIEVEKLMFETENNWNLQALQPLVSVSHPCGRAWRTALGIVSYPHFFNGRDAPNYDPKMTLFDHCLQFGIGSSGAALLNQRGRISGMQSSEITKAHLVLSAQPLLDALKSRGERDSGFPPELLAVFLADVAYGSQHFHDITTIVCGLRQAVHIEYMDRIIRGLIEKSVPNGGKKNLNELIEEFVRVDRLQTNSPVPSILRNMDRFNGLYRPPYTPHSHHSNRPPTSRPSSPAFNPLEIFDNSSNAVYEEQASSKYGANVLHEGGRREKACYMCGKTFFSENCSLCKLWKKYDDANKNSTIVELWKMASHKYDTERSAPPPSVPAPAVSQPLASTLAAPAPAPAVAPVPSAAVGSEANVYDSAASLLVAGSNFEGAIQQILDMGGGTWDRDTVIRALRAAYNNPKRAVEYLYSGIPEQAEAPPVAPSPASGQAANPLDQPPTAAQPLPIASTGPNANPSDLFPEGLPDMGSTAAGAGNLDFLRTNQQFQALRPMVQTNPQILQPMLQELGKQNPNLMMLIQEHQADFLQLINEPIEGGKNLLGQPQAISVTPEERDAIERLEAMGFD